MSTRMGHASYPGRRHGASLLVLSGTCWPAHDTPARHRVPFSVAAYARGIVDQRRSGPTAQDDEHDKNTNSLASFKGGGPLRRSQVQAACSGIRQRWATAESS